MTDDVASLVGSRAREIIGGIRRLTDGAGWLLSRPRQLRDDARQQVVALNADAVDARLRGQPITALRAVAGPGVRLTQLERAGFRTVADLLAASPQRLDAVPGVGPATVSQALTAAQAAAARVQSDTRFRFDPDRPDDASTRLLATLAALRAADQAVGALRSPLHLFLDQTTPLLRDAERTGSRVRLLFTGRAKKDQALSALEQLRSILADSRVTALGQELDRATAAVRPTAYAPRDLWRRYLDDAASVNALLSTVDRGHP